MDKKFQAASQAVSRIEKEIEIVKGKISEVEARKPQTENNISVLTAELEAALVSGDSTKIVSLEKEVDTLRLLENRDSILLPALEKRADQINSDLSEARDSLNLKFAELATRWIESEIKSFDVAAENLSEKLRRLLAVQEQLRERGFSGAYAEAIGLAADVLMNFRIPLIKNFDRPKFLSGGRQQFGQDFRDKIYKEIIK